MAARGTERAGSRAELRLEDVRAGYGVGDVLAGVSLSVPSGGVIAVLGPNGAGKSTLLRAISGVVRPQSGTITWDGEDISGTASYKVARRGIAHVPEGRGIFAELSVDENLKLGLFGRAGGRRDRGFPERRAWLFDIFPRLKERRRQQAGTLSGGEQQMLAIARALVAEPRLVILDEPSLGLSPRFVEEVFERLGDIAREGRSILLVEQNAGAALDIAGHAYVLRGGRVVLEGSGNELLGNEAMRAAYLGA